MFFLERLNSDGCSIWDHHERGLRGLLELLELLAFFEFLELPARGSYFLKKEKKKISIKAQGVRRT